MAAVTWCIIWHEVLKPKGNKSQTFYGFRTSGTKHQIFSLNPDVQICERLSGSVGSQLFCCTFFEVAFIWIPSLLLLLNITRLFTYVHICLESGNFWCTSLLLMIVYLNQVSYLGINPFFTPRYWLVFLIHILLQLYQTWLSTRM